jgi:iron complex transport system permease protein
MSFFHVHRLGGCLCFAILAIVTFLFSLIEGSVSISAAEAMQIFTGETGTHAQILWNIRMPRAITAVFVGMSLAVSGAILQAIMRNPLADPHIIGISSGAGLAGVMVLLIFPGHEVLLPPVAFLGAMGAAFFIYFLAWKDGIRPIRMILAGVAVSAFLGAFISALLILESDRIHSALLFMVGGLSARTWSHAWLIAPYAIIGSLLAFLGARSLNLLQLGDDMARSLGLQVELVRFFFTAISAILAAAAVSVAGLLGFVGLIIPHAARLMIGTDYRFLLPASAFLGAAVLSLADTIARTALAPLELPVGILMAVLGAPFFLFLLRREL